MASFSMPVHAPCRTVQPCHCSAKRGQLIFLSPSTMTRCDPHIPASLRPCSHRRQKCPTVAVVLLPFCWTGFTIGISDQHDDACLDTFTQKKKTDSDRPYVYFPTAYTGLEGKTTFLLSSSQQPVAADLK